MRRSRFGPMNSPAGAGEYRSAPVRVHGQRKPVREAPGAVQLPAPARVFRYLKAAIFVRSDPSERPAP